ncbi:HAD family hydrolase [Agromyces sp. NPDC058136]|uniref:HAD family hydrolase n=1 Tax=Agromyces sp. NPDC058136 TaxID=3346354 RepID=UPI0036DF8815
MSERHHEAGTRGPARAVLFDVDGTLLDALDGQRRIWRAWAEQRGLDPDRVYDVALRTRPLETASEFLPASEVAASIAEFDSLEDAEAEHGELCGIPGADELLTALPRGAWAVVTSNAEGRVVRRFARLGLPAPTVVVDNAATGRGKPAPDPYLLAAERLDARPVDCLVVEDSPSGVAAGLAARMTVWSVNRAVPIEGAHRHFATLADAAPEILRFVDGDLDAIGVG